MSNLHKNLETQLRHAFLESIMAGSREPLDKLRHELKLQIKQYETPSFPETSLDKALQNPDIDMREASQLLALDKKPAAQAFIAPLNEHPDKDDIVKTLKQTRKTVKELNIGYRAFTPIESAKYIGTITAISTGLFTLIPLITAFNTASLVTYAAWGTFGLFAGAVRGVIANNAEYFDLSTSGLKNIQKSMKPS